MSSPWRAGLPVLLILLFTGGVMALGIGAPERYTLWLQEDGAVEWMTVWAFVAASFMFALDARRSTTGSERAPLVLLAAFSLLVVGEELSWGQRLLTFQPPELFLEKNYQQESNVHNLLKGVLDSRWLVTASALGYGVVAPAVAWKNWLPQFWAPAVPTTVVLLLVAALELTYPLPLTGELAEAVLGFAFLLDASDRRWRDRRCRTTRAALAIAGAAVLGAITPVLFDHTLYSADPESVLRAEREIEEWRDHVRRSANRKMLGKRRVHKRIFTAVNAGYLQAMPVMGGEDTDARRWQYALDPWHQPYWLLHHWVGSRRVVLIYSFGPNRRRDTRLDRMRTTMSGDDIGIRFEMPR